MADRVYCDLDDVKRLLRSVSLRESRIRFSDAYRDLKVDSDNSGSVRLSAVVFSSKWAGHEDFTFTFTDSTSFEVEGNVLGYLGAGNRLSSFSLLNKFTVSSDKWSGGSEEGDKVYITACSDISDDDAEDFILDVSKRMNSKLEKRFADLTKVPFLSDLAEDVPDGVQYACARYSAYEIFNSVYAGSAVDENSPVSRWSFEADEVFKEYLEGHGRGPIWKSRSSLITILGIEGIGEGEIEIDELSDAKSKEYER